MHSNKTRGKIIFSDKERLDRTKVWLERIAKLETELAAENVVSGYVLDKIAAAQTLRLLFKQKSVIGAKGGRPQTEGGTERQIKAREAKRREREREKQRTQQKQ